MLDVSEVSVAVGPRTILEPLSFSVAAGEMLGVVASRPPSRRALLRLLTGQTQPLPPGSVRLGGLELPQQPLAELARHCAYLPERTAPDVGASVLDVVRVGRAPHRFQESGRMNREIAEQALDFVGASSLAALSYVAVSPAQQRRVQLALRIAQLWQPQAPGGRLLVLAEPRLAAEPQHDQHELLASARRFAARGVVVVLVVSSDVELATRHSDHVLLLEQGRALAQAGTQPPASESGLGCQLH